jgi:AraC family transcriptional regulator
MARSDGYGSRFGDRLHVENAPSFVVRTLRKMSVAVTEVRSDKPDLAMSEPIATEDAFLIALQLREFPVHEYWEDGKQAPVTALKAGDTTIYDLKRAPSFLINNPFHSVHFYFPRIALNAVADNAEVPRIGDLRYRPGVGTDDPVIRALATSLLPAFGRPEQVSQLFFEHVMLAVGAHAAHTYGGLRVARRPARGGLAPWQERRAKEMLNAHLGGDLDLSALAKECRLSASHFSRAFRETTGLPPHKWLLARRVEEAKRVLRNRRLPLAEVALACGFGDQSHLTRIFSRAVGISPGAWRRSIEE